jgi:hypothetical protein
MRRALARLDDHVIESIIALFLEGYDYEEMAEEFELEVSVVQAILADRGYKDRYKTPPEVVNEWIDMYVQERKGAAHIADHYGVSSSTVLMHLYRRGVRVRHCGHRGKVRTKQGNERKDRR